MTKNDDDNGMGVETKEIDSSETANVQGGDEMNVDKCDHKPEKKENGDAGTSDPSESSADVKMDAKNEEAVDSTIGQDDDKKAAGRDETGKQEPVAESPEDGNNKTNAKADLNANSQPPLKKQRLEEEEEKAPGDSKQKKHIRSKHVDPRVLEIRKRIQIGCRDNDLASALGAYHDAIDKEIRLEAQSFYNLLNLCDGLERSVHVGTPKVTDDKTKTQEEESYKQPPRDICPVDLKTRQEYVFRIKDHMKTLNLPLNETAYTAVVKILSRNKEYEKAEQVLTEAEHVQQCKPKLRLYSSLIIAYCEVAKMVEALLCWKKVVQRKLEISEKECLALMRCAIATGDFCVMETVLTNLAEDVPVPCKDTVAAILEWFQSAHARHKDIGNITPQHADDSQVSQLLVDIQNIQNATEPPLPMGPVVDTNGWDASPPCPTDTKTGILLKGCLKGAKLKPVPLSARAWEEMKSMNATIVMEGQVSGNTCQFQGGRKGKRRTGFSPESRTAEWDRFNNHLRTSGPFDVVVDGANVGYFKQNFADAPRHVDYEQIDWVIRHFTKMGKRVLLVIHERHFSPGLMPSKYKTLENDWQEQGVLYKTPRGMNDDWFWLHAALEHKTLVLTNDEMRDHHFQMLAPRIFLRWKERHQVRFEFGAWGKKVDGNESRRKVELTYPEPYSRRIQRVGNGFVVPLAKRGDENRFLDGGHVACDDEPLEEMYLCIRPTVCEEKSESKHN